MKKNTTTEKSVINLRFAFLDYLRIFAFMSVLIGHKFVGDILFIIKDPTTHITLKLFCQFLIHLFILGGSGIVVFFLISGYIITHVLQDDRPIPFLVKRFFRIYPLYCLATIIYFLLKLDPSVEGQSLSTLLYRLALIGDFTQTTSGLHGVEWTLRIELYFYLLMFCIRSLTIIPRKQFLLPWVFFIIIIALYQIAPFPNVAYFNKGYVTFYLPFLFCGAMFYLYDKKVISLAVLCLFIIIALLNYFILTAKFHPALTRFHFVILAFTLFVLCWKFQTAIKITPLVLLLSDITYPMYLIHHWLFDLYNNYLLSLNIRLGFSISITLIMLFITCYLLNRYIEKPFVRLGRKILNLKPR